MIKSWTKKELNKLEELYKKYTLKQCALILDIPKEKVKSAIDRYRIKSGRTGKFEVGFKPKHATGVVPKSAFKNGHTPKNKVGLLTVTERKDGKFIKTENGWIKYNKYLWEQEYGEVPKNMCVISIEGELKLATRQELLKSNTNIEKATITRNNLIRRERLRKKYGLKPLSKIGEMLVKY